MARLLLNNPKRRTKRRRAAPKRRRAAPRRRRAAPKRRRRRSTRRRSNPFGLPRMGGIVSSLRSALRDGSALFAADLLHFGLSKKIFRTFPRLDSTSGLVLVNGAMAAFAPKLLKKARIPSVFGEMIAAKSMAKILSMFLYQPAMGLIRGIGLGDGGMGDGGMGDYMTTELGDYGDIDGADDYFEIEGGDGNSELADDYGLVGVNDYEDMMDEADVEQLGDYVTIDG